MVMRFSEPHEVSAEGLQDVFTMTEEELRARYPKRKRGEHTWVVAMVFSVDDPTEALDNMTLGIENMVGFISIWCVWCQQKHHDLSPLGPDAMCPGVPKPREPRAIIGSGSGKSSSYTGVRSLDPRRRR